MRIFPHRSGAVARRPARIREIALVAVLVMLLPSLLLTPAQTKENVKLLLNTDQGISKDRSSSVEYFHTKSSGFPRDLTNGTAPTAVNFKDQNVTVVGGTQPVLSNVFSTGFTISWVMETNGTGKVSCSTDPNMSSPAPRWTIDGRRGIPSAVAYVNVTSCGGANPLTAGVTVYWRAWFNTTGCTAACIKGTQQANVSWPQGIPFPAARTKTSGATQSGNPTITLSPYEDRNTNGIYNAAGVPVCNGPGAGPPGDAPLCEFLVYLNHSGAGTLAFRSVAVGAVPPRWTTYLDTDLFRNNDTVGIPHALAAAEVVRISVWGLYNNLSSPRRAPTLWTATQSYTCCGALGPPNAVAVAAIPNFRGVGFGVERTWLSDPTLTTARGVAGLFSRTFHQLDGHGAPRVSNLGPVSFRVSWVTKEPVKGMIQVGTSPTLAGATYFIDPRWLGFPCSTAANCVVNATSVVDAIGLNPGAQYFWRAVEDDGIGHNRSFPSRPPYPSLWLKTDLGAPPTTNPTLLLRPFADMDDDGVQDLCTVNQEHRLRNFTGYVRLISPLQSEVIAARGAGGGGSYTSCTSVRDWRITINLNNLRENTTAGSPIFMSNLAFLTGTQFRFEINVSGLHLDPVTGPAYGRTLWKNASKLTTITKCSPWPACFTSPASVNVATNRTWNFLGLDDRANHIFRFNATTPGYLGMLYLDSAESRFRDDLVSGSITDYYDVSSPTASRLVIFGSQDIAYSTNNGNHWRGAAAANLLGHDWYGGTSVNADEVWAAGTETDGTGYAIVKSFDGGVSFVPMLSSAGGTLREIMDQGPSAQAVGKDTLVCTADGGATWVTQTDPIGGTNEYYHVSENAIIGVAVGTGGSIIRHTNWPTCTNSWASVSSPTTKDLRGIRCNTTSVCIAVGDGVIARSVDSGATWSLSTDGHIGSFRYNAVEATTLGGSTYVAVGEGGRILRSTNDGVSWLPEVQPTRAELRGVQFPAGTTALLVGDGAAVVRNVSSGWSLRSVPVGNRIQAHYQPDARRHTVAAHIYDSVTRPSRYDMQDGPSLSVARTYNGTAHRQNTTEMLNDTFPSAGAPGTEWFAGGTTATVDTSCGFVSSDKSLHFNPGETAESKMLDLRTVSHAELLINIRKGDLAGCPAPSEAEHLIIEYEVGNSGTWVCIAEFDPGTVSTDRVTPWCQTYEALDVGWNYRVISLPQGAYANNAQIRISERLSGAATGDWGVDDVIIRLRTKWTGAYMHQYDNDNPAVNVTVMSVANMTDASQSRSGIARADIRIYRHSDNTLVYSAAMIKTGIFVTNLTETFTTGYLNWLSFLAPLNTQAAWAAADGTVFVAIIDTYDSTGASDAALGHISRKLCYFQFDAN